MREAELNVVGTLLTTDSWNDDVLPIVEPQMFEDALLGKIYYVISKMVDGGTVPEIGYIATRITEFPQDIVLNALQDAVSASEPYQVKTSARILLDSYNARVANKILSETEVNGVNVYDAVENLRDRLSEIKLSGDGVRGVDVIASDFRDGYFRKRERKVINIGFQNMDADLGGLEGGDMIVIGARPAVGKTAFALQIASQMAADGQNVMLFNLEMTEKQIYERMLSYEGGIPLQRIRTAEGFMNEEERIRFDNANIAMGERKNLLVCTGGKTVAEIRRNVKAKKPDVVIIDYLQLLKPESNYRGNRYAEVGQVSRSIKGLAIEQKIPIIVLTQLNRSSEGRDDKEPTMADIRESGDIEQDASIIILLWNKDVDDRSKKGCKIDKNRQGNTGKYELKFNGSEMRFEVPGAKKDEFVQVNDEDELPFSAD